MDSSILAALKPLIRISGITELLQLKAGLRNACRISLPLQQEKTFLDLCRKMDFFVSRSLLPVKGDAQTCTFEDKTDSPWQTFLYYIANDKGTAFLTSTSEGINYTLHGKLFGYPECCVKFFNKNSVKMETDLTLLIPTTEKYNYLINRTAKKMGYSLISHFPCNWDCKKSIELAEKTMHLLATSDPLAAARLTEILNSNVFYSAETVLFCRTDANNNSSLLALYGKTPEAEALKASGENIFQLKNKNWEPVSGWRYLPFENNKREAVIYLH